MNLDDLAASPPLPQPDATSQFFWDALGRKELHIQRCGDCGRYIHYPKPVCRHCLSTKVGGVRVSGRGTLYSWTVAVQAFHPFWTSHVPYIIAAIELEEEAGLMFSTQLVGCDESELRIGLAVEVVFQELTPEITAPFFELVEQGEGR
jgi:uncharacterized protein